MLFFFLKLCIHCCFLLVLVLMVLFWDVTCTYCPLAAELELAISCLMQLSVWQGWNDLRLDKDSFWGLSSYECICFQNLPK